MAVNYVYLIHGSVKCSLLAGDSHEISCLIFVENYKHVAKFFVYCSRDSRYKGF